MASYIPGWNEPAFLTALTVTCGAKQIPKSLAGRPHVDLCCLSQARTCTHTHTQTRSEEFTHRDMGANGGARLEKKCWAGQLYGQAEISGCFPSSNLLVSVAS